MQCSAQNLADRRAEHNTGIDLLRLVAMFMVVILHVLGQGGVLSASEGPKNAVAWLLEVMAYCAVDCYAIISGYVCYSDTEKSYPYKKFLSFWVQVFTYSFGITLIAFLIRPEAIGMKTLIRSMLPVASGQYWYVSAYAGLFFVIPWINKLLRSCNQRECSQLVFVIAAVFMVYVTAANRLGDCFSLCGGYSFVWLAILYVVGAWMKKCDIPSRFKNSVLLIGVAGCILLSWVIRVFTPENVISNLFVNYTSVTIIYIAFALVAVFTKLQLGKISKIIVICFAPAAFGVYLIHVQPIIWGHFMAGAFAWIADSPCWLIPIQVLVSALCIFVCCLLIEKTRLILFHTLKIDRLIEITATRIHEVLHIICNKAADVCSN